MTVIKCDLISCDHNGKENICTLETINLVVISSGIACTQYSDYELREGGERL